MATEETRPRERGRGTTRADDLERVLAGQLEMHYALLACLRRKRDAIRAADMDAITTACRQEESLVSRLADREQQRRRVVAELAAELFPGVLPGAGDEIPVADLAARLDEPQRSRLLALREQLRETAATVRRESSIVRTASEALSRHLGGVLQSMCSALSRAGLYGRRGHLAGGAQIQSSVDIKS